MPGNDRVEALNVLVLARQHYEVACSMKFLGGVLARLFLVNQLPQTTSMATKNRTKSNPQPA
jgi:hypothetical protein